MGTDQPKISIEFGEYAFRNSHAISFYVDVTNEGTKAISSITVEIVYKYPAPQDATAEFKKRHPEIHDVERALIQEQRQRLLEKKDLSGRPLTVGQSREFVLSPLAVPSLRSFVESLPPEDLYVAVTSDSHEVVAVDGKTLCDFVRGLFDEA